MHKIEIIFWELVGVACSIYWLTLSQDQWQFWVMSALFICGCLGLFIGYIKGK